MDEHDVRHSVIAQLVAALDDVRLPDEAKIHKFLDVPATDTERMMAAALLATAALGAMQEADQVLQTRPKHLLDLDWHECQMIAARGGAMLWMSDRLGPLWKSRPTTALADVLKIVSPAMLAEIDTVLRRVGLDLESGA